MRKQRKARRKKTHRIYYNEPGKTPLWWDVNVTDAAKSVKLKSTLADALAGKAGSTVGCHLSVCAQRNKDVFPHPVIMAAFTRSVCHIIDQVKNGKPFHAWRYFHKYGNLVDLNDKDKRKAKIKARPELVEREITLDKPWRNPPRPLAVKQRSEGNKAAEHRPKRSKVPYGALARAVKAGLVDKPIATALST